jgi:signal transduction histidine kinase
MAGDEPRATALSGWSPRARLTVATAIVIAAVLAAASVLTVVALQRSLLSSIDTAARDDARDIAAEAGRVRPHGLVVPPTPDAAVQVIDARGRVIAASHGAPRRPLLASRGSPEAPVTAIGRLAMSNTADSYHVAALRTRDGSLTILVALPSDDVAEAVDRLTVVILVGAPTLLAILVALSWLVVGRALAPMTALYRRQEEFVSDAAHELRTPLSALMARLELAEQDEEIDVRADVPRLRAEVARLASLVDGLLALVRADNGALESEDVDLDDVVRGSVRRLLGGSPLTVDTSAVRPVRVRGDAAALGRLVDNLVQNAAHNAASRIWIALGTEKATAVLTVADDGAGVPAADRERVFDRFTRLDASRARPDGGVGLGLAIVRAVAVAHRGEVRVEDNQPGARLVVRLPSVPSGPRA